MDVDRIQSYINLAKDLYPVAQSVHGYWNDYRKRKSSTVAESEPKRVRQEFMAKTKRRATTVKRSRHATTRKRSGRRSRRSRRRVLRRGRGRRGGARALRSSLLRVLAVLQTFGVQIGARYTCTSSSSTLGKACLYFTGYGANGNNGPISNWSSVPQMGIMQQIGYIIDNTTNATNLRYIITEWKLRQQMVNCSNAHCNVVVYKCRCREDIPVGNAFYDITNILNTGFADQGSTDAQLRDEYTPFNSNRFVEYIKITKVKKFLLQPGEQKVFNIIQRRPRTVNLHKYVDTTGVGVNWKTGAVQVVYPRGARFNLYKISGQLVDNVADQTITFTHPVVDFLSEHRVEFKLIISEKETIATAPPLQISAQGVGGVLVMNQDTDTATAEVEA